MFYINIGKSDDNMPPKPKITKSMILTTVLDITRETGFESVNARSIAGKLQCSTRPIFTCYDNMDELKMQFLDFAFEYYEHYVQEYNKCNNIKPYLLLPLSYIAFAKEETNLFHLLFISDMALNMREANDFYKELGNEEKAKNFSQMLGLDPEQGKEIFLDLFFYSHGIAVLTATGKLSFENRNSEKMLQNFLSAYVNQEQKKAGILYGIQSISY